MPACQVCGVEHDARARFCGACGAPTFQLCAVCGAESPAAASFCSACGAGLRDGARRGEPVAAADERRVVTILFADLAGSTALGEQLDPEDVRDVQGRLFDVVDAEVTRFGGVSEKFAGDAVMAVFGIPQAHEDDAERAVLAALATQRRFPDLAERVRTLHGSEVALRIGVNTGEVVTGRDSAARGEMMVSGDAVNVAARLQQHAEPGAVLVGERTMSASRGAIGYGPRTELRAKGKSAPLPAWPAQGALDRPRRRGIEGLRAPMVGRDQELALLITLAGRVAEERAPQVVTLLGVAGVGKTRLLDELAVRVPARVLRGRCIPYGEGVAYWPLAEVAKAEAGIFDSDSAAESLEKLRAAFGGDSESAVQAAAWTIGLDTGSIEVESDVVRRRLHDHWTRYLATAAAAGPVLLVIEDIHWASTEMLDLIERLAARLEDAPVMILCSSRPELLESRRSWGAGLPNATTVSLTPLRAEQARLLLAELLELGRMPDDALERILARAEGNPFYIEEILRMLIDRGAIERAGSGWRSTDLLADMPIPDSVHGVIAARIDLLDAPSRDALRRCSVIGRRFWPDAVGVSPDLVSGIGGGLVAENAESAMGAMREFSYRHALTRDVAYSSLSRPERRELHVQVADWIVRLSAEQGREDSELIADHLIRAIENGADDPLLFRQAVDAQRRAGQAALARGAAQSALPMLMRAHELSGDPAERQRIDLLIAEAAVHASAGELVQERLQPLLEQAERDADDGLLADVLPLLSRAHWILGDYDRAAETAARAVAVLGEDADDAQRAHAVARHAQIQMLRSIPEAEQNAEIALELARRVGDRGSRRTRSRHCSPSAARPACRSAPTCSMPRWMQRRSRATRMRSRGARQLRLGRPGGHPDRRARGDLPDRRGGGRCRRGRRSLPRLRHLHPLPVHPGADRPLGRGRRRVPALAAPGDEPPDALALACRRARHPARPAAPGRPAAAGGGGHGRADIGASADHPDLGARRVAGRAARRRGTGAGRGRADDRLDPRADGGDVVHRAPAAPGAGQGRRRRDARPHARAVRRGGGRAADDATEGRRAGAARVPSAGGGRRRDGRAAVHAGARDRGRTGCGRACGRRRS